jgi:hypothetical protein
VILLNKPLATIEDLCAAMRRADRCFPSSCRLAKEMLCPLESEKPANEVSFDLGHGEEDDARES